MRDDVEPVQFVLGADRVRARAADERVSREGAGRAPFGSELKYDRASGEFELVNPVPNAVDAELSAVCKQFAQASADERRRQTTMLRTSDFYTLLTFSERCTVFAMRERRADYLISGLAAVAMIGAGRIEQRDVGGALALLEHAARAIGQDPPELYLHAAAIASPEMAELIIGFLRWPDRGSILDWGRAETVTDAGVGFVNSSFDHYAPTLPLGRIAVRLSEVIGADAYEQGSVTIRCDLPPIWLRGVDDALLSRTLTSVRAGASILSSLRADLIAGGDRERVIHVFLVELRDEGAAEVLLHLARRRGELSDDIAMFGVQEKQLFCLLVARSVVEGVEPVETSAGICRFKAPFAAVLHDFALR